MNTETMGLDFVRTFVKVGQSNTMGEASKKLHLSQSNVSRHIKILEEHLNTKLIENVRGKIVLTEDGQEVFKLYEEAYNKMMYAEKMVIQNHSANSGKISIGCVDGLDVSFFNEYISKFYKKYPNLVFKISVGKQNEISDFLSSYKVDFIINYKGDYKKSDNFIQKKLNTMKYCFISKDKDIDLNKSPLILPTKDTYNRDIVNQYFEDNEINPNVFLELSENKSIIEYVKKGIGVGFVPEIMVAEDKTLNKISLPDKYDDELYIVYNNDLLANTVREFIDDIVAHS